MNQNNQNNPVQMRKIASIPNAETYTAPDIEIIDIEMQQNILGGSGGGTDDIPGGGFW